MINQTILHYKILKKLGEGGMGVVYLAEDSKLKRKVAIKFLPRHIAANAEERQRFEIEAQAAAALNHPNIATIHAIEEAEEQIFIVMEYIDGRELKADVGSGKWDVDRMVDIATQIAEGLKAAHDKGIVHRDIKSANIMITESGRVKIMDFGLAKIGEGAQVTQVGSTLGTAAYMSPEQAQGKPVDLRTDIWSFGVVLYELLTGELPFPGDYPQAVMFALLNEPFAPLPDSVPASLKQIVRRTLEKAPDQRYANMKALLADLKPSTASPEAHSATAVTPGKDPEPATSKRPYLPYLLAMVALVAAGALAAFLLRGEDDLPEGRIPLAVADFVNYTGEKELDALSGMMITALEQSRRLSVMSRARMFDIQRQLGKTEAATVDEQLGREICRQAGVMALVIPEIRKFGHVYSVDVKVLNVAKGNHLFTRQEKDEGQESIPDLIDRVAEAMRVELREDNIEIQQTNEKIAQVTTTDLEAYQLYFQGEDKLNYLDIEGAKTAFRQAIARDSTFGLAYYRLAYTMGWTAEKLATEPLQKALKYIDRIPEKERFLVRAEQARQTQGFTSAVAILKEMETLYPNDKEMLFNIGDYAFHSEDYETALTYFDKLLLLDPRHQRTRFHYAQAAMLSYANPDTTKNNFRTSLQKALQGREKLPNNTALTGAIASLYTYLGEYQKAEQEITAFLATAEDWQEIQQGRLWLLSLLPYTGQYARALELARKNTHEAFARADTTTAIMGLATQAFYYGAGLSDREALTAVFETLTPWHNHRSAGAIFLPQALAVMNAMTGAPNVLSDVQRFIPGGFDIVATPLVMSLTGRCEQAAPLVETVQNIPGLPNFIKMWNLYSLAACYVEHGEVEKSTPMATEAFNLQYPLLHVLRGIYYPKTLLLMGKIHEAKGETAAAIQRYREFLALWKNADPDIPDLLEAKQRLARLRS